MAATFDRAPRMPLGELLLDSCYGTSEPTTSDGITPVIGISHVRNGTVHLKGLPCANLRGSEREKLALREGDLLFTRTNSPDMVGQTGFLKGDTEAVFASYLVRLRVNERRLDPRYLNYWMNSPAGRRQIGRIVTRAVGQANVNPTELRRAVRVPVPELSDQRRFADMMSIWDEAVLGAQRRGDLARRRSTWLADRLFRRVLEGRHEVASVGDIASIRSGGTPSRSRPEYWGGTEPWVSAKDLRGWVVAESIDRLSTLGYRAASVCPEGSVLVLTRGMMLFRDVPVCIAGRELAFNQDVKALVVQPSVNPYYLGFFLRARRAAIRGLVDAAGHGTGRLDTGKLGSFEVQLPRRSLQDDIVRKLADAEREVELAVRLAVAYLSQRDGLMRLFFSESRSVELA